MKVAIQGVKNSFHEIAAKEFWKENALNNTLEISECSSFPKLFLELSNGNVDFAVMAIENAIAGSILPNYSLMEKYSVKILGEIYLKIEMCLLSLPEDNFEDIKIIQSHPMAIIQCQDFLNQYPHIKILEHADTAESAKEIRENFMRGVASIANRLAAKEFKLKLLRENIETNSLNFTRFLILCRDADYKNNDLATKATIRFEAEDKPGSLSKILQLIFSHKINMTKIQSIPVLGRPYYYGFHIDLEWDNIKNYRLLMEELKVKAKNIIHFGEYFAAVKPTEIK